ncbi:MAG: hypothetical protein IPJ41_16580 [Phycisphaerales bacterium]|nr:hypothetical protein [Phycisphaerales bacterium]
MNPVTRSMVSTAALLAAAMQAAAQCEMQLIHASDFAPSDSFAYNAAISGSAGSRTLFVGAPYDDNARGADAGAVYLFAGLGNGTWSESTKIIPPSNLASGLFGSAVDASGDAMLAAAQGAGRALVYRRFGNSWSFQKEFLGNAADAFGQDVAMEGSVGVIGAPFAASDGDANAGRITILEADGSLVWSAAATLGQQSLWRATGDWMGYSVATNGTDILAGAPRGDSGSNTDCGYVMVVRKTQGGWSVVDTLFPQGLQAGQRFGTDVDIDGDYAVVGAPNASVGGNANAGLAYLYHFNGSYWSRVWTLRPSTDVAGANFGNSVSIKGDRVAVAAPGEKAAFVFRNTVVDGWRQIARVSDPDGGADQFARRVTLDASQLLVGDPTHDLNNGANAGAEYAFGIDDYSADTCESATYVVAGTYTGCTVNAALDGSASCGGDSTAPDVFFRYLASESGQLSIDTFNSSFDTVLSVHTGCPADASNEIACNDDWTQGVLSSKVVIHVNAGAEYLIRLGGYAVFQGEFVLNVSDVHPCPADFNADGALNTLDFIAFLNAWNAKQAAADFNGDGVINTIDVLTYLNAFTAGC